MFKLTLFQRFKMLFRRSFYYRLIPLKIGMGEALDRLSILSVKAMKFTGRNRAWAEEEHSRLKYQVFNRYGEWPLNMWEFYTDLVEVNLQLFNIEDKLRGLDSQVFKSLVLPDIITDEIHNYIYLAREVYVFNNVRSNLKKNIDYYFKYPRQEVKEYTKVEPIVESGN